MSKVVHLVFDAPEDCPYFGMEDDRSAFCNHPKVCNSMGEQKWCVECPLPNSEPAEPKPASTNKQSMQCTCTNPLGIITKSYCTDCGVELDY